MHAPEPYTHITQVLIREPALIGLADSGELTGKVMRLKLMVIRVSNEVAIQMYYC